MLPYSLGFRSPGYLLLLALLPLLWWFSFRSLAGLGSLRRLFALALRTLVLVAVVLALAEVQWVRTEERLTVIYLLDVSQSIPVARRKAMADYVNKSIAKHREKQDRAGVIAFGHEAAIEIPPFDEYVPLNERVESPIDDESTNLAGALKLAQATFKEDTAKRIVIVSDGKQNIGDALEQARSVAEAGIGIDTQPVTFEARADLLVDKLTIPPDVRKGQPFDLRVVISNTTVPGPGESGVIGATLVITRKTDDQPVGISEQHIEVPPGKQVYTVRQELDNPHFYTYEARVVPDDPAVDALQQNNRATIFTHVRGKGQVLLIEDHESRGQHEFLVERLRAENLEVQVRPSDNLPTSLAELQPFDTIVLANVPREHFTAEQVAMLAQNTQGMGAGLVMLGGENSFGAGGWNNTEVEEAMPVDFQIKSAKVMPKGALVLLMHASEMPDGNHWQKVIAKEAIRALGGEDYCGVLPGTDQWMWSAGGSGIIRVKGNKEMMLGRVDRMTPMDMPDFDSGLERARKGFLRVKDAAAKHIIIISDGDPVPPSTPVINGLKALKVTASSVAVGAHGPAESAVMKDLATRLGGKYYQVQNPNALPRIFQKEARRVARPLVYERDAGFRPYVKFPHEMVSGIESPLPPLFGFVQTSVKKNPLVEVSLVSPEPAGSEDNTTILASWTYGLGKAVAFTSDTGGRWAKAWTGQTFYDKLFAQMVRWSMRPVGDQAKFTVATDLEQGVVSVFVTALDKNDEFLNFLDLSGAVIDPEGKSQQVKLAQTAPGRYVGSFPAQATGSYHVMLSPGAGRTPLLVGVNVPYSQEFRDRGSDEALMASLAELTPTGGKPGMVIKDADGVGNVDELLKVNTFRHDLPKATSRQEVWHLVLLAAACVFFGDVFVRRVALDLAPVAKFAGRLRDKLTGRATPPPPPEFIARLRSRKAEVSEKLEQQRASARFEPSPDAPVDTAVLEEQLASGPRETKPPPGRTGLAPEKAEEDSYTSRLLKVKKDVQKKMGQEE